MDHSTNIVIELTKALFWDVDPESIDCEKHAAYIIERVLSRGTLEDFIILKAYYGKNKIKQVARNLRYIDERVLNFCSVYFNLPITEFRCYTTMQLNQSHWNY